MWLLSYLFSHLILPEQSDDLSTDRILLHFSWESPRYTSVQCRQLGNTRNKILGIFQSSLPGHSYTTGSFVQGSCNCFRWSKSIEQVSRTPSSHSLNSWILNVAADWKPAKSTITAILKSDIEIGKYKISRKQCNINALCKV